MKPITTTGLAIDIKDSPLDELTLEQADGGPGSSELTRR